ncbi:MAG: AEC family transporter [Lachnospiraceae bacterium]|nr:AEC family transporter [Lachnospiraceae bacterium]
MSITIVVSQMVMIFAMILVGVYLYKTHHITTESSKDLSWIIVNITNPITLLCAALKDENKIGIRELGTAFLCFVGVYALLIAVAYILPRLLMVEKDRRYEYRMLTIFGNVGFIGIPFASAVLGPHSLIFVAICGLVFNFIMYSYGFDELSRVAGRKAQTGKLGFLNSGTVMAVVTLVVYIVNVQVPVGVSRFLEYIGNCTTFLSMIVLGVSVAQMVLPQVFGNKRLYLFIVLRQVGVPILVSFLLRPLGLPELMLRTIVVMCAMPAGNMPLMVAKSLGIPDDTISGGIIFTTLATIVTIPIVMLFL